ncbi:MAG TPA: replicative DNA helicase [Rhodothermales bacterium]|nr:replicative DNA helicase [Rhodothermales bacterium]
MDEFTLSDESAERAVLGCLLMTPDAIGLCAGILAVEDFTRSWHRAIYKTALELHESGVPVEQVSLLAALNRNGANEGPDDDARLLGFITEVPTVVYCEQYARTVEDLAARRRVAQAGRLIEQLAAKGKTAEDAITQATDALTRLTRRKGDTRTEGMKALMDSYYKQLDAATNGTASPNAIPTGLLDLDRVLGGLRKGEMTLLAARPSIGKTSLALLIALHAAREGHPAGIVSLEMGKDALSNRLVSMVAEVDGVRLRQGRIEREQFEAAMRAMAELSDLPIDVDDTAGLTVADLRYRVTTMQARTNVELVVIDYLQLLRGTNPKEGRVQEVSEISRQCKALARDLNVAVLGVSQLNRQVEGRQGGRPQLSDLKESGQLEQDADVVLFLHREEQHIGQVAYGLPQVITATVAKHRNGPLAEFSLQFVPEFTLFRSMSDRAS